MAGKKIVLGPINVKLASVSDLGPRYWLELLQMLIYRSNLSWNEMESLKRAQIFEYAKICKMSSLINWIVFPLKLW